MSGQLHTLRYAHEHGCTWNARTVDASVREGKHNCLAYALQQGCPSDHTTCTTAAAQV
jgi:hypothetical protein